MTVSFALGPTNTGKTHRAIERMLAHPTGMIGFPLRLLAREVYDRVTAQLGEREVALVTGEEKRIPDAPRYWIATVEAMPVDRTVDFLAVDEIQLAAHRERGHVFTDRLLNARGRSETMFLGAHTMTRLVRELFEGADVDRPARLSTLRYVGKRGLGGLPSRSAVVAFSADEVYEIAGRIKARRGGAAVVLGGLSPRTRNAQVALYQSGEVQHLVATDAIGMGLNLDLDHVAFASVRKFDGKERRRLTDAELGQVAGRAGRHRRDGTFGTLTPQTDLNVDTVRAIEGHDFPPVRRLVWRSSDLDFSSADALITSLARPSPDPRFVRVEQSDDFDILRSLTGRREIRERASAERELRLLWEVCQVPDYRKLMLVRHLGLLAEVFAQLVDHGRIDADWIEGNVRRIDRLDGEVDTLTARLSAIRVWTYVSHRVRWVDDTDALQERTRDVEDRLSDALHQRLVERFVERGGKTRRRSVEAPKDGPFAGLGALLEDAEAAAEEALETKVSRIVSARSEQLVLDADGAVRFDGERVARLRKGPRLTAPTVQVDGLEGAGARRRVERRLVAWSKDLVAELAPPPDRAEDAALRGLLYQLGEGLGAARKRDVRAQLRELDEAALESWGVIVGRRHVYLESSLSPEGLRARAALVRAHAGSRGWDVEAESLPTAAIAPEMRLPAGYDAVGPRLVRIDVLERALGTLRAQPVPFEPPEAVAASLGINGSAAKVWSALGYRLNDAGQLVPRKRRRRR